MNDKLQDAVEALNVAKNNVVKMAAVVVLDPSETNLAELAAYVAAVRNCTKEFAALMQSEGL